MFDATERPVHRGLLMRVTRTTRGYPDEDEILDACRLVADDMTIVIETQGAGEVRVLSRCGLIWVVPRNLERVMVT